jgi:hypothetical protein
MHKVQNPVILNKYKVVKNFQCQDYQTNQNQTEPEPNRRSNEVNFLPFFLGSFNDTLNCYNYLVSDCKIIVKKLENT